MTNREISHEQMMKMYHKANMSPVWGRMPKERVIQRPIPTVTTHPVFHGQPCIRFPESNQSLTHAPCFPLGHLPPLTDRTLPLRTSAFRQNSESHHTEFMLPNGQTKMINQSFPDQNNLSPHHTTSPGGTMPERNQSIAAIPPHRNGIIQEVPPIHGHPAMMICHQNGLYPRLPHGTHPTEQCKTWSGHVGPHHLDHGLVGQRRYNLLQGGVGPTSKVELLRRDSKPYSKLYGAQEDYTKLIRRDILKCIRTKMMTKQTDTAKEVIPQVTKTSNSDTQEARSSEQKAVNDEVKPDTTEPTKSETDLDKSPALADMRDGAVYILCDECSQRGLFLCSGCHRVAYCSRQCQTSSWPVHKSNCKE